MSESSKAHKAKAPKILNFAVHLAALHVTNKLNKVPQRLAMWAAIQSSNC